MPDWGNKALGEIQATVWCKRPGRACSPAAPCEECRSITDGADEAVARKRLAAATVTPDDRVRLTTPAGTVHNMRPAAPGQCDHTTAICPECAGEMELDGGFTIGWDDTAAGRRFRQEYNAYNDAWDAARPGNGTTAAG